MVWPFVFWYEPAAHCEHVSKALCMVPAAHSVQLDLAEFVIEPLAHVVHEDCPVEG